MTRQNTIKSRGKTDGRTRAALAPVRVRGIAQFADVMYVARRAAGMSADGIARRLGKSRSAISYRENGQRSLTVQEASETLALCGYALVVVPVALADRLEGTAPDGPSATEG
jgi:transcriptional regulator with XRE-family HTH domain